MRFAIENGLPYLISNGRAYPVEINGNTVRYDDNLGTMTELQGCYTLTEIQAKLGDHVSSIKKRRSKSTEVE